MCVCNFFWLDCRSSKPNAYTCIAEWLHKSRNGLKPTDTSIHPGRIFVFGWFVCRLAIGRLLVCCPYGPWTLMLRIILCVGYSPEDWLSSCVRLFLWLKANDYCDCHRLIGIWFQDLSGDVYINFENKNHFFHSSKWLTQKPLPNTHTHTNTHSPCSPRESQNIRLCVSNLFLCLLFSTLTILYIRHFVHAHSTVARSFPLCIGLCYYFGLFPTRFLVSFVIYDSIEYRTIRTSFTHALKHTQTHRRRSIHFKLNWTAAQLYAHCFFPLSVSPVACSSTVPYRSI